MAQIELICFSCQKPTPFVDSVGYRAECMHCGADSHACKNCKFYDKASYNECKESSADRVQEKERANYCDYFHARMGGLSAQAEKDKLKTAAEALFKKNT